MKGSEAESGRVVSCVLWWYCTRIVGRNGQGVVWELKVHCKAALHLSVDLQMATKGHGTQRSINLSQTGTMALHETDLRLKSWSWSFKPPKSYHDFMFIIWSSLLFRTSAYLFIAYIRFFHNRFKVLPKRWGITHKDDPFQKFIFLLFKKLWFLKAHCIIFVEGIKRICAAHQVRNERPGRGITAMFTRCI